MEPVYRANHQQNPPALSGIEILARMLADLKLIALFIIVLPVALIMAPFCRDDDDEEEPEPFPEELVRRSPEGR